jgi:hypothetical protein
MPEQDRNNALDRQIVGIAATLIASRQDIALEKGTAQLIQPDDILYAFTKGGVSGGSPLILAQWGREISFAKETVYVRTEDALYRVSHASLRAFKELLPETFQQVSKSVVANLRRPQLLELHGSANRGHALTYTVALNDAYPGIERIRVGREFLSDVRARFG